VLCAGRLCSIWHNNNISNNNNNNNIKINNNNNNDDNNTGKCNVSINAWCVKSFYGKYSAGYIALKS